MVFKGFSVSLAALSIACAVAGGAAFAQSDVKRETAEAVKDGDPARYSLVSAGDDILRVDRQNGTVSICKQKNASWRCNPVPLAEDAYQAEINALAGEVERLTARLQELEADRSDGGPSLPPGAALDRPKGENSPQKDPERKMSGKEEEEELDKVLTFTETAMRRLFGMVRELQRELDHSGN